MWGLGVCQVGIAKSSQGPEIPQEQEMVTTGTIPHRGEGVSLHQIFETETTMQKAGSEILGSVPHSQGDQPSYGGVEASSPIGEGPPGLP